jgi:hypothetical protein
MYTVGNAQLSSVIWFPRVTAVNLSQCGITDLSPLRHLQQLRSLELACCRALPPGAVQCLATLSQLSKLDLSGCARAVTDAGMRHLASGYPANLYHI